MSIAWQHNSLSPLARTVQGRWAIQEDIYFTVIVDGQWTVSGLFNPSLDCSQKTKTILVDLWMELKFYFCPWDNTDEPGRGSVPEQSTD